MTSADLKIDANPERRFFISMLTKDIELIPAVIDLVDNCVDGARSLRGDGSLARLRIDLTVASDRFEISDNCGGIAADVARHYAFRFGRPLTFGGVESSVGQFGVGMKRALFKLGSSFVISSVASESAFKVAVNVEKWAEEPNTDWSFEFAELIEGRKQAASKLGTTIVVAPLLDSVAEDFSQPTVPTRIAQTIAIQHQAALSRGLAVRVNGVLVKPVVPMLLQGKDISPIRIHTPIKLTRGTVDVDLIAGIAVATRRDSAKDDGAAEEFTDPGDAGWYVFCNDRLVMEADKTEVSGWGASVAAYHPQYRRFRGYVFLAAKDSSLLPWNTTKTALDQDSHVFRVVRQQMIAAMGSVLAALNRQKVEVAQRDEDDETAGPITAALAAAKEVQIRTLPVSPSFRVPPPPPRQPAVPPSVVQINFKVDREQLEEAMEKARMSSRAQLGATAYEYYLQYELDMEV